MRKFLLLLLLPACAAAPAPEPSAPAAAEVVSVAPQPPAECIAPGEETPLAAQPPAAAPRPPLAVTPPPPWHGADFKASAAQLTEVNDWATHANVRFNLNVLVGWLSAANTETSLEVKYVGGESPNQAMATLVQTGYLDDSIRGEKFTLQFSKAADGSGWKLDSVDVLVRCWPGRGQQDFKKARCN